MPTGYTHDIKDGISFNKFAMNCARAFGACIMMRDEPNDKEIPEKFEPSDYHQKNVSKAKESLESLKKITIQGADAKAKDDFDRKVERQRQSLIEEQDQKEKYESMLENVELWTPPSKDHEEMKSFMSSQIRESIKFDCDSNYLREEIKEQSGEEWLNDQTEKALKDIDYHTKGYKEEVERTEQRNLWIKQLRESLK